MTARTKPEKVPATAFLLLRYLGSHANAHVVMHRDFPLTPYYKGRYWTAVGWKSLDHVHEGDLATLSHLGAVSLTREATEGKTTTRVWQINAYGRELLDRHGVLTPAQDLPELFDTAPYDAKQRRSSPRTRMDPAQ